MATKIKLTVDPTKLIVGKPAKIVIAVTPPAVTDVQVTASAGGNTVISDTKVTTDANGDGNVPFTAPESDTIEVSADVSAGGSPTKQTFPIEAPTRENSLEDLRELLIKRKAASLTLQVEANKLNEDAAKLQANLAELEKASLQVDQAISGYEKAQPGFDKAKKALQKYLQDNKATIEASPNLNGKGDKIRSLRTEQDTAIKALEDRVKQLQASKAVSQTGLDASSVQYCDVAFTEAQRTLGEAQKAYDSTVGLEKVIKDRLTSLEGLKKEIEDAVAKGDFGNAVFLVTDLYDQVQALEVMPPRSADKNNFASEIDRVWRQLNLAKTQLRATETELNARRKNLESATTQLNDAKTNRKQRIQQGIKAILEVK